MERLSRKTVESCVKNPERIIQFGEGNFLRAFVDWIVVEMNDKADFNAGVVVVQPIERGMVDMINEQNGLFTLILKGLKNGRPVREREMVDTITRGVNPYTHFEDYLKLAENPDMRFIVSNTTEAGIAFSEDDKFDACPPTTFPGKLTVLLHHRYKTFNGDRKKGFILFPCELIDRNGDNLKKAVLQFCELWNMEKDFIYWVLEANTFCNTLVDRIVPGYPKEEAADINEKVGFEDKLIVEAEPYHLWVIEGPESVKLEFPAHEAALNVLFVDDMTPYRTRKVCILNGAHTLMAPVAYLAGIDTVREAVEDDVIGKFMLKSLNEEIIPTINLPEKDLYRFALKVLERFRNPYIHHSLYSILLNTVSKYKARNMGSLLEYVRRRNSLPRNLVFSLAALIVYYRGDRNGVEIVLQDDAYNLRQFARLWAVCDGSPETVRVLVKSVLSDTAMWDQDLSKIPGLTDMVSGDISSILSNGMLEAVRSLA